VGVYDVVLLCTPPAVAASLCGACAPALSRFAERVPMEPCWVAALLLGAPLPVHFHAAAVLAGGDGGEAAASCLAWASRESARELRAGAHHAQHRPGRAAKMLRHAGRPSTGFAEREDSEDLLVLHSTAAWARDHPDERPADVAGALLAEFLRLLGGGGAEGVEVVEATATLWREARARLPPTCLPPMPREGRPCATNAGQAHLRAGFGADGFDGSLFDAAKVRRPLADHASYSFLPRSDRRVVLE
jgi:hypothetical protein